MSSPKQVHYMIYAAHVCYFYTRYTTSVQVIRHCHFLATIEQLVSRARTARRWVD